METLLEVGLHVHFPPPSLSPVGTSLVYYPDGIWRQCSRNVCREHYLYHSSRGPRSEGRPSVLWSLTSVLLVGVWVRTDLTLSYV